MVPVDQGGVDDVNDSGLLADAMGYALAISEDEPSCCERLYMVMRKKPGWMQSKLNKWKRSMLGPL
jgi:hypothetical protein